VELGQEISIITPYIVLPIKGILIENNNTHLSIENNEGVIFILQKNTDIIIHGGISELQF